MPIAPCWGQAEGRYSVDIYTRHIYRLSDSLHTWPGCVDTHYLLTIDYLNTSPVCVAIVTCMVTRVQSGSGATDNNHSTLMNTNAENTAIYLLSVIMSRWKETNLFLQLGNKTTHNTNKTDQ